MKNFMWKLVGFGVAGKRVFIALACVSVLGAVAPAFADNDNGQGRGNGNNGNNGKGNQGQNWQRNNPGYHDNRKDDRYYRPDYRRPYYYSQPVYVPPPVVVYPPYPSPGINFFFPLDLR